MTVLAAVTCSQCGGAIRAAPGRPLPACLFCGADATDLVAVDADVEIPTGAIPFALSEAEARDAFERFATSSVWYPSDLRHANLELRRLLLPAWTFSGTVETHFTGLVSANTSSGKRPVSGVATAHFDQVLVPSSSALTLAELRALGRYREALEPFDPERTDEPWELPRTTREAARAAARAELVARHAEALMAERSLLDIHPSARTRGLTGRPVLVPVFVGVYRYRDVAWRFLVNGQTGATAGEAPTSWAKVALAVAGVVLLVFVLVAILAAIGAR